MKTLPSLLAGLTALGLAGAAEAQSPFGAFDGFYVIGYGGLNAYADNDSGALGVDRFAWDSGLSLGGRVGAKSGRFRFEGELGYRTADGQLEPDDGFFISGDDDVELSVLQGSINGFYDIIDIELGGLTATPYAGGGLGFANVEVDLASGANDETGSFAMIEAGMTLRMTPNLSVVPAYRYEYVDVEIDGLDPVRGHGVQIGARLDF